MRHTVVGNGSLTVPVVGQGTWGLGAQPGRHKAEVDALREGFALGMTLVDTAEFYADGESERVIGDAIADCRDKVYLVTKVWPHHASEDRLPEAVRGSLRRLRTDHVDALLLHWPTRSVPLEMIAEALLRIRAEGLTRTVGWSNFPLFLARQAENLLERGGGNGPAVWELPYSLADRHVESALLPERHMRDGLLLAYSPLGHGRLLRPQSPGYAVMERIAKRLSVTPSQVALAFVTATPGVTALPKAVRTTHVRENAQSGDLVLEASDLRELDAAFPRGARDRSMEIPPYGPVFATLAAGIAVVQTLRGRYRSQA